MTNLAAIDVGTNTIRLLVASPRGNRDYDEVVRDLRIPRLGHEVDAQGMLRHDRIRLAVSVVSQFVVQAQELGARTIRIAATSAVRDATNRDVFLDSVEAATGLRPDILTGDQEASLAFAGAAVSFPPDAMKVVIDIGGGSTEMITGRRKVLAARSVDVGSVRLSERHIAGDPPAAAEQQRVRDDAAKALALAAAVAAGAHDPVAIGVAGTFTTLAALALELRQHDRAKIHRSTLTLAQATALRERLARLTIAQKASDPVITPGRADAIVAGAILVEESMRALGVETVTVSETDILDGLLLSLL